MPGLNFEPGVYPPPHTETISKKTLAEGFMDTCRELGGPHHELDELSLTIFADNRWCSPAAAALQHQAHARHAQLICFMLLFCLSSSNFHIKRSLQSTRYLCIFQVSLQARFLRRKRATGQRPIHVGSASVPFPCTFQIIHARE